MVRVADAGLGLMGLADRSHGLGLRVWAAGSRSRVKGLAEKTQGFRFRAWAAEPGFRVKGLVGQN